VRRLPLLSCIYRPPSYHAKADTVVIEENFFGERSSIVGTVYRTSGA
jgi:hypothetical protein